MECDFGAETESPFRSDQSLTSVMWFVSDMSIGSRLMSLSDELKSSAYDVCSVDVCGKSATNALNRVGEMTAT